MKRTSAKEVLKKFIGEKPCVVVFPNTDWMEHEYDSKLWKERMSLMQKKLGVSSHDIVDVGNDYFVYEFKTEEKARKFFFSFGEEYEVPFSVQLYIKEELMGENT